MTNFITVLDHGFVRLVAYMGSDMSIVRAARVSYNAEWRPGENKGDPSKDEKLIHYMMKNRHTTPFEAVQFTFEVKAPIFVFRQWHRHRTWSYNEVSARYSELPKEFYVPNKNVIGTQDFKNRQGRLLPGHDEMEDAILNVRAESQADLIRIQNEKSYSIYQKLLEEGVPRELARSVLPVGMYSRMFASVDLHNLFHFLGLRLHHHAQYEIRQYAGALLTLIKPIVPISVAAWEEKVAAWEEKDA